MNNNSNNPKNYKKPTFFEKIANFLDNLTGGANNKMTDEESAQFEKDFDRLRSYKGKGGKRKWFVKS